MFKKNSSYLFKQSITDYFYYNKVKIIFLSSIVVVGIIFGILNVSNLCRIFTTEGIIEKYLLNFLGCKVTTFTFFFKIFMQCTLWMLILYLFSLCRYIHYAIYVFFVYIGFVFGYNIAMLFVVYGVGGIFNIIIFYIPLQIVILCFLMLFGSLCIKSCKDRWTYGKHYCCPVGINFNFHTICYLYLFLVLTILLQSIIMPSLLKDVLVAA